MRQLHLQPPRPGFGFARRNGATLIAWRDDAAEVACRDDVKPEAVYEDLNIFEIDPTQDFEINCDTQLVTVKDGVNLPAITAFRLLASKLKNLGRNNPILLKDCLSFGSSALEPKIALLRASVIIGSCLPLYHTPLPTGYSNQP